MGLGFKKSVESSTTRPIHNRLGPNRVNIDIRYETGIKSVETRYNLVKLGELD